MRSEVADFCEAARHSEDVSWLAVHLEVPFLVYQADVGSVHGHIPHNHSNTAREASALMRFIAEYYDCLPEVTAFVHGHRSSWHSPDMVKDLHELKWDRMSEQGYLPLNRGFFQPYGTWVWLYPSQPERHLQTQIASGPSVHNGSFLEHKIFNGSVYDAGQEFHYYQAKDLAWAWQDFFEPAGFGPLPAEIRYFCCAQFVLAKDRINWLPRSFYLKAIYWLEHSELPSLLALPYARGMIFEALYHVIFGEPLILQPPKARECELYSCEERSQQSSSSMVAPSQAAAPAAAAA